MFGIGPQEVVVIVLLLLIIFGPRKVGDIAKDLGRWVNEARSSVEEFKEELNAKEEEPDEEQHPAAVEGTEKPSAKRAQEEEAPHKKGATAKK